MAAYMTDEEIEQLEEGIVVALNGDHCRAVDVLARGLIRTLAELKLRRSQAGAKTHELAQSA